MTDACNETFILQQAINIIESRYSRGTQLLAISDVRDYLMFKLAYLEHEVFAVLLLDNQQRIIVYQELFRGTINKVSIYPREVVKLSLHHNAAALILVHNHPSGSLEPSQADVTITQKLKSALELIDVDVLDHFIVAGTETVSMADRGLM
ncbi:DNA repair protein RadC [Enterobacter asburiae]|nr:DNA repair protein RadC [Enterobacter asburiae]